MRLKKLQRFILPVCNSDICGWMTWEGTWHIVYYVHVVFLFHFLNTFLFICSLSNYVAFSIEFNSVKHTCFIFLFYFFILKRTYKTYEIPYFVARVYCNTSTGVNGSTFGLKKRAFGTYASYPNTLDSQN